MIEQLGRENCSSRERERERETERERERSKQLKEDSSNNQLSMESIADDDVNVAFHIGSSSNVQAS